MLICLGGFLIVVGVALSSRPPVLTVHIEGRNLIMIRGYNLKVIIRIVRQYREEIESNISEE